MPGSKSLGKRSSRKIPGSKSNDKRSSRKSPGSKTNRRKSNGSETQIHNMINTFLNVAGTNGINIDLNSPPVQEFKNLIDTLSGKLIYHKIQLKLLDSCYNKMIKSEKDLQKEIDFFKGALMIKRLNIELIELIIVHCQLLETKITELYKSIKIVLGKFQENTYNTLDEQLKKQEGGMNVLKLIFGIVFIFFQLIQTIDAVNLFSTRKSDTSIVLSKEVEEQFGKMVPTSRMGPKENLITLFNKYPSNSILPFQKSATQELINLLKEIQANEIIITPKIKKLCNSAITNLNQNLPPLSKLFMPNVDCNTAGINSLTVFESKIEIDENHEGKYFELKKSEEFNQFENKINLANKYLKTVASKYTIDSSKEQLELIGYIIDGIYDVNLDIQRNFESIIGLEGKNIVSAISANFRDVQKLQSFVENEFPLSEMNKKKNMKKEKEIEAHRKEQLENIKMSAKHLSEEQIAYLHYLTEFFHALTNFSRDFIWDTFISMSWFLLSKTTLTMIPVILFGLTVGYLIPSSKDLVFNVTKNTFVFIFKGAYNIAVYPIVYAFNSVTGMIYVGRAPGPMNAPANAPAPGTMNAPANAPANAPVNAPANAPMNAPANAPMNAPANAPMNAPANAPMNAPVNSLVAAPVAAIDQALLDAILSALRNNISPSPIIPNRNADENAIAVIR
jgi:hypothetical protein